MANDPRQPANVNKRVLLFFPFCFTKGTQGNEVRVLKLVDYFLEQDFVLDVLSYQGQNGYWWDPKAPQPFNGTLELVEWGSYLKRALRKFIFLMGKPFWGHSRVDPEVLIRFRQMLRTASYSHVVVSYVQYAYLLSSVKDQRTTKVCDTHDIWTIVEKSRHQIPDTPKSVGDSLAWEISTLNSADIAIAISPSEEQFFKSLLSCRVALLPPWFDERHKGPGSRAPEFDLIYVGTDNYLNVEGLKWFFKEVFPAFPKLRLLIVGKICKSIGDITSAFPNVTLRGFVADVSQEYESASAALCPMLGGAGVKIKVLEALSYGLPVFASRIVEAGLLPGYEKACFLADGSEEFKLLLSHFPDLIRNHSAASYFEKYSKESISERAHQIFQPGEQSSSSGADLLERKS